MPTREQTATHAPPKRRASAVATATRPPTNAARSQYSGRNPVPAPRKPVYDDDDDLYDDVETDDLPVSRMPRSGISYKQLQKYPVSTASPRQRGRAHPLFIVGIAIFCIALGIWGATIVPPAIQNMQNNANYGYPRTQQVSANVGHGGISHFIALNNNGTLEVIELPTDPAQGPHLYVLATLSGQGADLSPLIIHFLDANGDGKLDLVAICNGIEYIWYNNGKTFAPKL